MTHITINKIDPVDDVIIEVVELDVELDDDEELSTQLCRISHDHGLELSWRSVKDEGIIIRGY